MSLLPSRLDVSSSPDDAEVLDIDADEAAAAFDALGSETARRLLSAIYEEPRTPPELREEVGTSLQNVHYHLDRLEEAGLVAPAGSGYSEKGNEMTVYGPAREAVVLFAGDGGDRSRFERLLKRVLGLGAILVLSTLVFAALDAWLRRQAAEPGTIETEDVAVEYETVSTTAVADATGIDPVAAFFLGGVAVLAVLVCWWLLAPRLRGRTSA